MKLKIKQLGSEIAELRKLLNQSNDKANDRIKFILEQLGIKGDFLEDGRFQCEDGRILGFKYDENGEGHLDFGDFKLNLNKVSSKTAEEILSKLTNEKSDNDYLRMKINKLYDEIKSLQVF